MRMRDNYARVMCERICLHVRLLACIRVMCVCVRVCACFRQMIFLSLPYRTILGARYLGRHATKGARNFVSALTGKITV